MMTFLQVVLLIVLVYITAAYDPFEGLIQQGDPCFEEIYGDGCGLTLTDVFKPPYEGSDINKMDTKFWLFTVTNPDKAEPLHKCGGRLPKNSKYDATLDTIVIAHGWLDGVCRTAWMREFKEQFFQRGKYNVILVDYTWGNTFDFAESSDSTFVTGEDIGFVILNIMEQKNMTNGKKFHLIGHSYGTFVVSECGKYIYDRHPSKRVRRITLLEPAPAPYRFTEPTLIFRREYADFIDAYHSDAGHCFPISFGTFTPVAHVDFYPNGGGFQVSCYPYAVETLLRGDIFYGLFSLLYPPACSHLQVLQYFKVTINHPQGLFIGAECNSYQEFLYGFCHRCCIEDFSKCAVMGMDAEKYFPRPYDPYKNRKYYLILGLDCPYNEDYAFSIFKDCTLESVLAKNKTIE